MVGLLLPIFLSLLPFSQALPSFLDLHYFSARAVAIPTGWSSLGCVSDDGVRFLQGYYSASSTNSIGSCLATCGSLGWTYASVEYGSQCYCGTLTRKPSTSTSCNMVCTGDPTQTCGGSWAMNLYQYTAAKSTTASSATSAASSTTSKSTTTTIITTTKVSSTTATSSRTSSSSVAISTSTIATKASSTVATSSMSSTVKTSTTSTPSTTSTTSSTKTTSSIASPSLPSSTTATSTSVSAPSLPSNTAVVQAAQGLYIGCYTDYTAAPLFTVAETSSSSMTNTICLAACGARGYSYAGTEGGQNCFCGAAAPSVSSKVGDGQCSQICAGGGSLTCGSSNTMSVWQVKNIVSTLKAISPPIAASNAEKKIWAHHMVGNTYPYVYSDWVTDIQLAQSAGIDGFVLNLGPDDWQPARIADAYRAAQTLGTNFKLLLSFDMSAFDCTSTVRLGLFQNYVSTYLPHPNAATYGGKPALSTFGGEWCTFGQSSVNAGWQAVLGSRRNTTYFMPAYTPGDGPRSLNTFDIDAEINWGSAWPTGNTDLTSENDKFWLSYPKKYIATVSPMFFSHFPWKNWQYRGDNFLYSQRWEMLLGMRDQIDQVEIISWNDYGESHYIGPIKGDQPPQSKVWTMNPDFDHTAYLSLQAFYSQAWKTGQWPSVTTEKAWLTTRPHTKSATASDDQVAIPTGSDLTQDFFYAQVHLVADALIVMSTNSFGQTFLGKAGVNRLQFPLEVGSGILLSVLRGNVPVINLSPSFTFSSSPAQYNFNYYVWQS